VEAKTVAKRSAPPEPITDLQTVYRLTEGSDSCNGNRQRVAFHQAEWFLVEPRQPEHHELTWISLEGRVQHEGPT
jgi:hypothetical protein